MADFKTNFAALDGVHIHYSDAKHGVEYECIGCGSKIKLRGGDKIRAHFYHAISGHCSNESILHKVCKSILVQHKKFRLPYEINGYDLLEFDDVRDEVRIGDIVADCVGYINGTQYIIEFANTHFIDKDKKRKLKKIGIPCVEMDVSCMRDNIDFDGIIEYIVNQRFHKELITWPGLSHHELDAMSRLSMQNEMLKRQLEQSEEACKAYLLQLEEHNKNTLHDKLHNLKITLWHDKTCSNGAEYFKGKINIDGVYPAMKAHGFLNNNNIVIKFG